MPPLFSDPASISPGLLEAIAHMPTTSLPVLVSTELQAALSDAAVMRIAVHLAAKSRAEGGCPIGAVVRRDADGVIVHRIYGQIPDRASLRDDVARYLGVEVGDG